MGIFNTDWSEREKEVLGMMERNLFPRLRECPGHPDLAMWGFLVGCGISPPDAEYMVDVYRDRVPR